MHSNLAKSLEQYETQPMRKQVRKVRHRRLSITKGEKFIFLLFCFVICFFSIHMIHNQATLYEINTIIQNVEREIDEHHRKIEDLEARVNELSRYDRLMEEAEKQELSMNPDKVRVVQGNE